MPDRSESPAPDSEPRDAAEGLAEGRGPGRGRRVLIVEDDVECREMMRELLHHSGWDVHAAADGLVGVSMVRQVEPDVVILDLGLPRMDGVGVARQIRSIQGDAVRIIAVTGRELDAESAPSFDELLRKPVPPELLLERLSS